MATFKWGIVPLTGAGWHTADSDINFVDEHFNVNILWCVILWRKQLTQRKEKSCVLPSVRGTQKSCPPCPRRPHLFMVDIHKLKLTTINK